MVEEADQIRDGGVGDLVFERLRDRLQRPDALLVLVGLEARDMVDGVSLGELVAGGPTRQVVALAPLKGVHVLLTSHVTTITRDVSTNESRRCFRAAAGVFVDLVGQVRNDQWALPGLGVWDIRSLVGHTTRALSTIETYFAQPTSGPVLSGPVEYFLSVLGDGADAEERRRQDTAIAERGRQAGADLGDDPAKAVRDLAQRVLGLVDASPDETLVATPAGAMALAAYLPTRTFELTVHSLDLTRSLDLALPAALAPAIAACCELAGALAARRPNAASLLLNLTGRNSGSESASVL